MQAGTNAGHQANFSMDVISNTSDADVRITKVEPVDARGFEIVKSYLIRLTNPRESHPLGASATWPPTRWQTAGFSPPFRLATYQDLRLRAATAGGPSPRYTLLVHLKFDDALPASFRVLRIFYDTGTASFYQDTINGFTIARRC